MIDENNLPADYKSGFIALVGRPNVGKSTLMNALLEEKIAIVTPRPQTTRTQQLGILTTETYQIIFIDTPGMISKPRHKLDEFMLDKAGQSLEDADSILWLVDSSVPPGTEDKILGGMLQLLDDAKPVLLGMNKIDAVPPQEILSRAEAYRALLPKAEWIMFSALKHAGLKELTEMMVNTLPVGPLFYPPDQITETYVRDIAAEMIREQILLQLREEIPYGTAVQILEFKERDNGTTYISANIFVERDSHKRIIIGKQGTQLRKIGSESRKEIENLIQGKVFLELWVKVEPKWRRNENALKRFGYSSN